MKHLVVSSLIALLILMACTGDKPLSQYEASDEEAIFNVITIDNIRLSELAIFPSDVPDTLEFIQNPDAENPLYWHTVDSTDEQLRVLISNQPVDSPVGLVEQASGTLTKTWLGVFNSLRYNDDADSLERYAREFELAGTRSSICQKWGQSSHRRGWILTSIGSARFTSPGGGQSFLNNLVYQSESNSDSVFHEGVVDTDDILRFDSEEEVTIRYDLNNDSDLLFMLIPVGNYSYELASPVPAPAGGYQVTVAMPSTRRLYGQLRFLVINDGDYQAVGYSYNYRVR
ncbi:MAG: hypothetical protein GY839_01950 [candidate division Zixibacteria bacterium]|nr:hypothetical protein [candidate division Zixibacteria bacterium]